MTPVLTQKGLRILHQYQLKKGLCIIAHLGQFCFRDSVSWSLMCYCSGCMDFNYVLIDCVLVYGLLLGFNEDGAFVLIVLYIVYDCIVFVCCCLSGIIK